MTREQAAELITAAIVAAGPQDQILGADAFANRLATALDALGMLPLAANTAAPAPIADTGAKTPGTEWAEKRDRLAADIRARSTLQDQPKNQDVESEQRS
jgi:hypothetical protein